MLKFIKLYKKTILRYDSLKKSHIPLSLASGSLSALARMEQPKGVDWTVVILTCQYKDSVEVFQRGREPFALTLP